MTPTSERCELCGDDYHDPPDSTPDIFGLTCPGAKGTDEDKKTYLDALTEAFSVWVRDQALLGAEEAEKYAEAIEKRKAEWYARQRTNVTQGVLQDDCDKRVPEVQAELVKAEVQTRGALDIDPPHLTVPVEPQNDPSQVRRIRRRASNTHPEDALLYVDPPQGPEPFAGQDYYDAKAPGGWHTEHYREK